MEASVKQEIPASIANTGLHYGGRPDRRYWPLRRQWKVQRGNVIALLDCFTLLLLTTKVKPRD